MLRRGWVLAVVIGCKHTAGGADASLEATAPSAPTGVPPFPFATDAKSGSAMPPGLAATDKVETVLSCRDELRVLSLEDRPVVVRWNAETPEGEAVQFRLARWDEAKSAFEEMVGPSLKLAGPVVGVELGGTWAAPQLFVVDGNVGYAETKGRRLLDVNDQVPYQYAVRDRGNWRTGSATATVPPATTSDSFEKLDEDWQPDETKLKKAVAAAVKGSKGCAPHEGVAVFANAWKVGWADGPKCKKPIVYVVHQTKDGKVETKTFPSPNAPKSNAPRASVAIFDHAWHVFIAKPDLKAQRMVLDKVLRFDGKALGEVALPDDRLSPGPWSRDKQLCLSGDKSIWCRAGETWSEKGPGHCALTTDAADYQSGICFPPNAAPYSIIGNGKYEFRKLKIGGTCSPVWGRTATSTLLCASGGLSSQTATLVLMPNANDELDIELPKPASEALVTFAGNVPWVARNLREDSGPGGLAAPPGFGPSREAKIVARLGKPVKAWTCSADGSKLER